MPDERGFLVGRNIHAALDDKLQAVQDAMEEELKKITMADLLGDLEKEIHMRMPKDLPKE